MFSSELPFSFFIVFANGIVELKRLEDGPGHD